MKEDLVQARKPERRGGVTGGEIKRIFQPARILFAGKEKFFQRENVFFPVSVHRENGNPQRAGKGGKVEFPAPPREFVVHA